MRHKYIALKNVVDKYGRRHLHTSQVEVKVFDRLTGRRKIIETIVRSVFIEVLTFDGFQCRVCIRYRNENRALRWSCRHGYHITEFTWQS